MREFTRPRNKRKLAEDINSNLYEGKPENGISINFTSKETLSPIHTVQRCT